MIISPGFRSLVATRYLPSSGELHTWDRTIINNDFQNTALLLSVILNIDTVFGSIFDIHLKANAYWLRFYSCGMVKYWH